MSFAQPFSEARSIIRNIEQDESQGSGNTSPILSGASTPGGAAEKAKPSGEVLQPGRLRAGIKTPRTRTDSLTRKYAASGGGE